MQFLSSLSLWYGEGKKAARVSRGGKGGGGGVWKGTHLLLFEGAVYLCAEINE